MTVTEQLYQIEHFTAYHYSEPVMLSHQQLHLTPRPSERQQVIKHVIAITPTPTLRREFIDAFGNPVTEVAIESAHTALNIAAYTTVKLAAARRELDDSPDWESVRDALAYRAAWHPQPAVLEATQFLFESPHIRVKRSLRAYASDCFVAGRPIVEAAMALMAKIHAEFKFDAKATTVATPVMTFFTHKHGVCQDFTHLMISCLRSSGLAARYVSGYLLTHPAPGKSRSVGADASHAWVSLFVPELGWIDFDPTNNVVPSLEHITVGWGRDFSDVTPLRGVINGGGEQNLEVKVTVTPS
ncbi:MAG TPA: transglutaminase family protein [Candidatus Binatia bacterium]|nr:transglutaminase family protein [Candidatus Binatia bacterium]